MLPFSITSTINTLISKADVIVVTVPQLKKTQGGASCFHLTEKYALRLCVDHNVLFQAFIKSSLLSDEELRQFFLEHLIWNNETTNFEMMREGLLIREHTPQILMRLFMKLPDYGLQLASPLESKVTVVDEFIIPE